MQKKCYNFYLLNFILILFIFNHTLLSQNNKDKILAKDSLIIEKVNNYLEEYLALENFSGSILISRDSNIIVEKSIGMANYEFLIPNSYKTKYRIASLSKAFTAVLILQQVEKGKIKLEGKIRDYISYYPAKYGNEITIHQLLTHTSGIIHYEGIKNYYSKYGQEQFYSKEYLKLFWNQPLLFKPGTSYQYSSFGYFVLGVILQNVTGKSYAKLLKENIFEPLGLQNTSVEDHISILSERANGYVYNNYVLNNSRYYDFSKSMATGDIISTIGELNNWSLALNSNALLSENYLKLLFNPNNYGYGYGWSIKKYYSKNNVNNTNSNEQINYAVHSGSTRGFESYMTKFLNYGYTIIILSNLSNSKLNKMNEEFLKIIIGDF